MFIFMYNYYRKGMYTALDILFEWMYLCMYAYLNGCRVLYVCMYVCMWCRPVVSVTATILGGSASSGLRGVVYQLFTSYDTYRHIYIHTYIHTWMIHVYIDRQLNVTPDHAILRWPRCTCRPSLENKPRRCGRAIVSQLSAKASTKLPHTYIHT